MDSHSKIEVAGEGDNDAELMAELEREVARNNEAVRLVKEKELQALAARDRAADSQRRMYEMVHKYEEMKNKLEFTRLTLEHTASQINKHDIQRAEQIRLTVTRLKEKAANCSEILRRKREREEIKISSILSGDINEIDQIVTASIDDDGSLTEAEKMLLLMCQTELSPNNTENEEQKQHGMQMDEHNQADSTSSAEPSINTAPVYDDSALTEAEKMLLLICQTEALENKKENESVAEILKEEQPQHCATMDEHIQADSNPPLEPSIHCTAEKKISKSENENSSDTATLDTSSAPDICNEISSLDERKESDHEHVNKESSKTNEDVDIEAKIEDSLNIIEVVSPKPPSTTKVDGAEASAEDFDLKEITKDLNQTVTHIEAKCAGVREELGQMAMSEQYMRTKQAQLFAKRREKEAERAVEMASKKEQEAQDMRRKVANMMKLLEERKNKLKVTENVLEKRTNVVDKVNKVLDAKLRRADFVQKQQDECVVFDKKYKSHFDKSLFDKSHKKSIPNKQQENADEHNDSGEKELGESTMPEEEEELAKEDDKKSKSNKQQENADEHNDSGEKELGESTIPEEKEDEAKEDDKI